MTGAKNDARWSRAAIRGAGIILAALATSALTGLDPASAQLRNTQCRKPAFRFCNGCAVPINIAVKAGGTCVFNLFPGNGRLLGSTIVTRPKHGNWGQASESRFAYQVRPNASGSDYFEVEIRYETRGRATSTRLQATVTISQ
jgi:hypothetical protein